MGIILFQKQQHMLLFNSKTKKLFEDAKVIHKKMYLVSRYLPLKTDFHANYLSVAQKGEYYSAYLR